MIATVFPLFAGGKSVVIMAVTRMGGSRYCGSGRCLAKKRANSWLRLDSGGKQK
jgi:hypothetical protein